jgi:hypothetical protein
MARSDLSRCGLLFYFACFCSFLHSQCDGFYQNTDKRERGKGTQKNA